VAKIEVLLEHLLPVVRLKRVEKGDRVEEYEYESDYD